jgi:hypothetical protein
MGIYITQQKKEEWEAKVVEYADGEYSGLKDTLHKLYRNLLSESIVLPVEESWEDVELYPLDNESQFEKTMSLKNGVIIKSKES